MAVNASEHQARQVIEAAHEAEWKLPSFGKALFLGDFHLELVHPAPPLDPTAVGTGERCLARQRAFLKEQVDPLQGRARRQDPDAVPMGCGNSARSAASDAAAAADVLSRW